jgi:hypothetical protein
MKASTAVFPYMTFTSIEGKTFTIPRERVIHVETYCHRNEEGVETLDPSRTFVNFLSPNPKSKSALHAVVNMPIEMFRDQVMKPAYGA